MKRYLKYVKPYWYAFILGPILMITEVAGEVILPAYMARICLLYTSVSPFSDLISVLTVSMGDMFCAISVHRLEQ